MKIVLFACAVLFVDVVSTWTVYRDWIFFQKDFTSLNDTVQELMNKHAILNHLMNECQKYINIVRYTDQSHKYILNLSKYQNLSVMNNSCKQVLIGAIERQYKINNQTGECITARMMEGVPKFNKAYFATEALFVKFQVLRINCDLKTKTLAQGCKNYLYDYFTELKKNDFEEKKRIDRMLDEAREELKSTLRGVKECYNNWQKRSLENEQILRNCKIRSRRIFFE